MGNNMPASPFGGNIINEAYESHEFNVNTGTTDGDTNSTQATFRDVVKNPCYLEISSDKLVTIKFNATTNPAITIAANTTRVFDRQIFTNVYISNASGSTAAIKMYIK